MGKRNRSPEDYRYPNRTGGEYPIEYDEPMESDGPTTYEFPTMKGTKFVTLDDYERIAAELAAEKQRHTETQKTVMLVLDRSNNAEAELAALKAQADEDGLNYAAAMKLLGERQKELAVLKAGAVTDEMVERCLHASWVAAGFTGPFSWNIVDKTRMRAALTAALVSHTTPSPPRSP